jgi:hypothetical protein
MFKRTVVLVRQTFEWMGHFHTTVWILQACGGGGVLTATVKILVHQVSNGSAFIVFILSTSMIALAIWLARKRVFAPLVVPVRYLKVETDPTHHHFGILLTNEGGEAAYDIRIDSISFGHKDTWTAAFSKLYRLGKGESEVSQVQISGRNCSLDLDWPLGMWQQEECTIDRKSGLYTFPPPLRFAIFYRNHANKWYKSTCELGRNVLGTEDVYVPGVYVRLVKHEPANAPTPPPANAETQ